MVSPPGLGVPDRSGTRFFLGVSPIELLARLGARISALQCDGASGAAIGPEDICHALGRARLTDPQRHALRAKYLGEEASGRCLVEMLGGDAYASLAVLEWCSPQRCPWCAGRGRALLDGAVVCCDACHGAGVRRLKSSERCRLLGVSEHVWAHTRYRYEQFLERLDRWEDEALSKLIPALRSIS